jgi:hypothetical protein
VASRILDVFVDRGMCDAPEHCLELSNACQDVSWSIGICDRWGGVSYDVLPDSAFTGHGSAVAPLRSDSQARRLSLS